MSTSIRICSYLLLPLIYLLVNVKIAQLGESFPITIVTFLPVLLLLFLERISVKKLMIALGIGAGLTAFNYLFGQSLDASKYVTSTMLFVYIVIIIGMVWSIRFKTISPHNHRKILRFFYLVVGLVVALAAVEMAQIILTGGSSIMESISKYLIYSNSYVLNFIKFGGKRTTALYFEPAFFALALISIWLSIKQFGIKTPKTDAMILAGIILSGSFSGVMTFILFYLLEWAFQYLNKEAIKKKLPLALISLAVFLVGVVIAFPYISTRLGDLGTEGSSSYYRIVGPLVMVGYSLTHIDGVVRFGSLYEYVASFGIFNGADVSITGHSGSGKSTLLRCINRLNEPSLGEVFINGKNITTSSDKELLDIRRKEMAMVFQHFGLLPHRTVLSNIAFGLELQGVPKKERDQKAVESVALVGLKGYENQKVSELSGGMQQRVGLARAIANDPEVLLMDEAFSALDPLIRVQMQDELLKLQEKMQKTIIFITHDLDEAIKLGDRIAIMKDGEVVQVGTPEEILTDPANHYVSRFTENVDRGRIVTASSIMITQPVVARIRKDGPETVLRKMKEKNLYVLPVVDGNRQFLGEVRLKDVLALRKAGNHDLSSIVMKEVPSVLENTTVEDMLPLLPEIRQALPVVNEANQLAGLVSTSSIIIEMTGKDKEEIDQIVQNAIEL